MRVAVVDPASYTPPYDHHLAAALARRGHDVDLLTSRFLFGDVPRPEGYRREEVFFPLSGRLLRRAPRSRFRFVVKGIEYVPSARRLARRIEAVDPDVVHLQWLPLPAYDVRWVAPLAARRPTVLTFHGVPPADEARAADRWRRVFGLVDATVAHSRRAVDDLARLGVGRERIVRIPHPVFDGPAGAPEPPRGRTVLFFGLLRAYKGLDLLVRALPEIAAAVPDVRLVVAGDPVDPVEPARELAERLGVAGRIEWRLRFLSANEIPAVMAEATLVALPYRKIDASGVLATAIGHGRPVVVSDVGSLGETVREFGAGLVVPAEDASALSAACIRLLSDAEALAAAFEGTKAAARALSWDAAAEAHERLYEDVRARRAAARAAA